MRSRPSAWPATAPGRRSWSRYPGLKEEYYLADFEPDPAVPAALGLDGARIGLVLRPPADVALYHRFENPLFDELLEQLGARDDVRAVVLPRTPEQAERIRALALPSLLVPDDAVDGQSLVAGADLVVSAGGTMNREAVVLGTPVYTTFAGRLGGVDERLIAEGRLRPLRAAGGSGAGAQAAAAPPAPAPRPRPADRPGLQGFVRHRLTVRKLLLWICDSCTRWPRWPTAARSRRPPRRSASASRPSASRSDARA